MSQVNPAEAPSVALDSTRPAERPAESVPATLGITQPPSSASAKPAISNTIPLALVDSTEYVRTTPAPSVVLETRYRDDSCTKPLSFLVPLRELLSWRALKDVLANIREVETETPLIIYYCSAVVIGKYWFDIIHDGANFVVLYTREYEFNKEAGVFYSKYWVTE